MEEAFTLEGICNAFHARRTATTPLRVTLPRTFQLCAAVLSTLSRVCSSGAMCGVLRRNWSTLAASSSVLMLMLLCGLFLECTRLHKAGGSGYCHTKVSPALLKKALPRA